MKTFGEFLSDQSLNHRLIETATIMAEKDVEPISFLQKWFEENHPEESVLLEGLWDNLKSAGSQMWQGVKQGAKQFAANQWGPQAKYDVAMNALNDLINYMQNEPELARRGVKLIGTLGKIQQSLGKMKDYMPQMQTQNSNRWAQPNAKRPQTQQPQNANAWQRGLQNLQAQQNAAGSVPMSPPGQLPGWSQSIVSA